MFQSTHPHGVRLRSATLSTLSILVSIHAPTRGATFPSHIFEWANMFQSTHPHGVRQGNLETKEVISNVSIHAPTRGATRQIWDKVRLFWVSIHAPTRGATSLDGVAGAACWFQSTHPHGVRHLYYQTFATMRVFQSTHPHGVRQFYGVLSL